MNTRSIVFKSFRNLGVGSFEQEHLSNRLQLGSIDGVHVGGLVILLGGNNDGKSNVLDGLASFSNDKLKDSDKPDYRGYNDEPKLTFEYKITDERLLQEIAKLESDKTDMQGENSDFEGKTFGLYFHENCLGNCATKAGCSNEEYCKSIQDMLNECEVQAMYGDSMDGRKEIRLIIPDTNHTLFCATDTERTFRCFRSEQGARHDGVGIKLKCKFKVMLTANLENCQDDARELKAFLQNEFKATEAISTISIKSRALRATLTTNGLETNLPKELETYKICDIKRAREHMKKCLSYIAYAHSNDTHTDMEFIHSMSFKELQHHYKNWQGIAKEDRSLNQCSDLQTLLQTPLESFQKDMQRQKDIDIIFKQSFGIAFLPKIVRYKESAIAKKDLKVEPSKIDKSSFFQTLFTILDKDIAMIQESYEQDDGDYLSATQDEINKLFESTINKRFNDLYCLERPTYSFHIRLDSAFVELSIRKNGDTINLERQSTGFRKFFNLFFNFLYKGEIGRGDIVLIDEPENSLSIPAQKDLRKFLKDYGRKSGILFIIATHSPFMLDVTHLDEVRIVKALNPSESNEIENPKGSLIINDFSMLGYGESDTLNELRKVLGANIELDVTRLIFVEGVMDYNILNAYSQIYDYTDSNKLIFLPISGLGSKDSETSGLESGELQMSEEQKQKARNLIAFAKRLRIHPILLVDNDRAGKAMKEGVEKEFKDDLSVITLKDALEEASGEIKNSVYAIESLFIKRDKEKFGFDICKENCQSSFISSRFKNTENLKSELSEGSKINLNVLFKHLAGLKELDMPKRF